MIGVGYLMPSMTRPVWHLIIIIYLMPSMTRPVWYLIIIMIIIIITLDAVDDKAGVALNNNNNNT